MKGTKHKRKTLPEQCLIKNYRLKEDDVIVGERIVTFGSLGRVKSLEAGLRKRKYGFGFGFGTFKEKLLPIKKKKSCLIYIQSKEEKKSVISVFPFREKGG